MLLSIPKYALDVYNALNGSHYTDPSVVQIMKLEKGILLSVYNDASFLLDSTLNLYEHQSSYNPNMPLRQLIYFVYLLLDMIKQNKYNLYGTKKIAIPTPKFIVFYNGLEIRPEVEEMYLSDAYIRKEEQYQLDLHCTVYNINPGMNPDLMKLSKVLDGYTAFVEKVRKYENTNIQLQDAITYSIDECIEQGILTDFFTEHRVEVTKQAMLDFTFEKQLELTARDSREDGYVAGINQGITQGNNQKMIFQICRKLKKNKSLEQTADELEEDVTVIEPLYELAQSFAPDYDEEKVFEAYQNHI